MSFVRYILENRLELVPVLIIIGWIIKQLKFVSNKYIPLILLCLGITLSILIDMKFSLDSVIQGILVTGAAVLGNQIPKQLHKNE